MTKPENKKKLSDRLLRLASRYRKEAEAPELSDHECMIELNKYPDSEFLALGNFGHKSIQELRNYCDGIPFGGKSPLEIKRESIARSFDILKMRLEGTKYKDIAEKYKISVARARQIAHTEVMKSKQRREIELRRRETKRRQPIIIAELTSALEELRDVSCELIDDPELMRKISDAILSGKRERG